MSPVARSILASRAFAALEGPVRDFRPNRSPRARPDRLTRRRLRHPGDPRVHACAPLNGYTPRALDAPPKRGTPSPRRAVSTFGDRSLER